MPKPNYGYEKRQRELEKKRKKEEKAQRKTHPPSPSLPGQDMAGGTPVPEMPKE